MTLSLKSKLFASALSVGLLCSASSVFAMDDHENPTPITAVAPRVTDLFMVKKGSQLHNEVPVFLTAGEDTQISDIRLQLSCLAGYQPTAFTLNYGGRLLTDEDRAGDVGLGAGSIVHSVQSHPSRYLSRTERLELLELFLPVVRAQAAEEDPAEAVTYPASGSSVPERTITHQSLLEVWESTYTAIQQMTDADYDSKYYTALTY